MSKMVSYTKHENEVVQEYRQRVTTAESTQDVRLAFELMLRDLLGRIVGAEVVFDEGDVTLDEETEPGYRLGPGIMENPDFAGLWVDSDLAAILDRLAPAAVKRLKRLNKNPECTEAKLYPRPDRH